MWFIFGALLGASSAGGDTVAMSSGGLIPLFVEERVVERLIDPSQIAISYYDVSRNGSITWHAEKAKVKGCLLGAALRIRPGNSNNSSSMWFIYTNCNNLKGGVGVEIGLSKGKEKQPTLQ